jgi:hypothetical protein
MTFGGAVFVMRNALVALRVDDRKMMCATVVIERQAFTRVPD